MQRIGYIFFLLTVFIFKWIPFIILYIISDGIRWILQHILKYRRSVILKNLEYAFPNKSEEWRLDLLVGIYQNFTDVTLESIKGLSMPVAEIDKRYPVFMPESLQEYGNENRTIVAYAAHYTNWEWGTITLASQTPFHILGLYKPIRNKLIDQHIRDKRAKSGCHLINIYGDKSALKQNYKMPKAIVFIGDQNPSNKEKAHNIRFFNQNSLALQGGGEYAKQHDAIPYFYQINRVSRGQYRVDPICLTNEPTALNGEQITQLYFDALEKQIRQNPANWLWTHKRWKSSIAY